ncbi:GNAT family N-acetyltransferase [Candidatus Stoquefichus massiliensis]|uniref:GNAT family N-acetyltransferase n=1 Tax=Candidatus Stoquefichus massiliensis TaxID=1470350 RepID=UPI0004853905|nr:GNAT family N-acetyltransferase [Candidatus Stoquefichus massiliensis]
MNQLDTIMIVIQYIEDHLTEKLSLTTIAYKVGYSKYHLHRMFLDRVGLSIHHYVQRRKLTEAAKRLVFTQLSIIEIALIAGYESQQAFTSVFKQMYKQSPLEYRIKEEFYPLQLPFHLQCNMPKLSLDKHITEKITHATIDDISLWMELVYLIVDGYPHFHEDEYCQTLEREIREKRAFILKNEKVAIAVMSIHWDKKSINFFGVHPLYRKLGIAKIFLDKMINDKFLENEIYITTYRKDDKADIGYRKIYQDLGFTEAELLIEFGYPTQRLVFTKGKNYEKS